MPSDHVSELIARGCRAPSELSPLEAVMGEDFAVYKAMSPRSMLEMDYALRQNTSNRLADARRLLQIVRRKPQAMVKRVAKGGAQNSLGIRAQMNYLGRNGEVAMHRSDRYLGVEIDDEERERIEETWAVRSGYGHADKSSHFVVSFPAGTDRADAQAAGRAWAEEMFGSGRFGDEWDYYTAPHDDTDHPHTHVVVARRGLQNGSWLITSRRSEVSYDRLREVQVEVAERYGIALEASSRLSRGVFQRPVPDARYRRAWEEGRAPEPPAHTPESAIVAAASVVQFVRIYQANAELVEHMSPELAEKLRAAANVIAEGGVLSRGLDVPTEIHESLKDIERAVPFVSDAAERIELQKAGARLRAHAPGEGGYREVDENAPHMRFSRPADTPEAAKIMGAAVSSARKIATAAKLDFDRLVARYGDEEPISRGLAKEFHRDVCSESFADELGPDDGTSDWKVRDARTDRTLQKIAAVYRTANARLEGLTRAGPSEPEKSVEEPRKGLFVPRAAETVGRKPSMNSAEVERMADTLEKLQSEADQTIDRAEKEIAQVEDPRQRVAFEVETGQIKADLALQGRRELSHYGIPSHSNKYRGLSGPFADPESRAIADEAHKQVGGLAERAGLNSQAVLARYEQPRVSEGLARDWREQELAEHADSQRLRLKKPEHRATAERGLDGLHGEISKLYDEARARIEERSRGAERADRPDEDAGKPDEKRTEDRRQAQYRNDRDSGPER